MSDESKPPRRRIARGRQRPNAVPPEVAERRLREWYDGFVADRRRRGIHEDGLPIDLRARGNS